MLPALFFDPVKFASKAQVEPIIKDGGQTTEDGGQRMGGTDN